MKSEQSGLPSDVRESAAFLRSRMALLQPRVGLTLGSGLGDVVKAMRVEVAIPFTDIPHFVRSTAPGHSGRLLAGELAGREVVVLDGRLHCYEGYTPQQAAYPVRVLHAIGVTTLILTNISGGLNAAWRAGDVAAVTDHIAFPALAGMSPLRGDNNHPGPRFPDMSQPYSARLLAAARTVAKQQQMILREGIYAWVSGPQLETRAEQRMLRMLGVDLVGMSTVPEVIAAVHAGMEIAVFSVVSNICDPDKPAPVNIDALLATANSTAPALAALVSGVIERV